MTTTINADQFVQLYEDCRRVTLAPVRRRQCPDFSACDDIADVRRIVANICPHLLELQRGRGAKSPEARP